MKRFVSRFFIPLASMLGACAALDPIVVTPTNTIEVSKPIPVACIKDVPGYPPLPQVPSGNIEEQVKAKNERELILRRYAESLYNALAACKDLK